MLSPATGHESEFESEEETIIPGRQMGASVRAFKFKSRSYSRITW